MHKPSDAHLAFGYVLKYTIKFGMGYLAYRHPIVIDRKNVIVAPSDNVLYNGLAGFIVPGYWGITKLVICSSEDPLEKDVLSKNISSMSVEPINHGSID